MFLRTKSALRGDVSLKVCDARGVKRKMNKVVIFLSLGDFLIPCSPIL